MAGMKSNLKGSSLGKKMTQKAKASKSNLGKDKYTSKDQDVTLNVSESQKTMEDDFITINDPRRVE